MHLERKTVMDGPGHTSTHIDMNLQYIPMGFETSSSQVLEKEIICKLRPVAFQYQERA